MYGGNVNDERPPTFLLSLAFSIGLLAFIVLGILLYELLDDDSTPADLRIERCITAGGTPFVLETEYRGCLDLPEGVDQP